MTKKLLILTAFLALAGGASAQAGSLGGVINVSMTVVARCSTVSNGGVVQSTCTAGEKDRVDTTTETPRDAAYLATAEGQDAHKVVTVSF